MRALFSQRSLTFDGPSGGGDSSSVDGTDSGGGLAQSPNIPSRSVVTFSLLLVVLPFSSCLRMQNVLQSAPCV
jgi:hypothetical protein